MGRLLGWLTRLLGMTLRVEMKGELDSLRVSKVPIIHVLWHQQICVAPYLWRKFFPKRKCVVLTSASKDGVLLGAVVGVFGFDAVHGSSSRRGVAALVALRKAVQAGSDVVITPDGPRGPRLKVKPGVIKVAQMTGCEIRPFKIEFSSYWQLKTWDRFQIPKPFSKAIITYLDPLAVPDELSEEGFEHYGQVLEDLLGGK